MRTITKKRLAASLVIGYLLWGGVHRYLVHRFEINPWKFGGMAMYAIPAPKISIGFFEPRPDGGLRPLEISREPADQPLFLRYFQDRRHAGRLLPPDALAERIFAQRQDVDACAIVVTRLSLDSETATIVSSRRGYRYHRVPE